MMKRKEMNDDTDNSLKCTMERKSSKRLRIESSIKTGKYSSGAKKFAETPLQDTKKKPTTQSCRKSSNSRTIKASITKGRSDGTGLRVTKDITSRFRQECPSTRVIDKEHCLPSTDVKQEHQIGAFDSIFSNFEDNSCLQEGNLSNYSTIDSKNMLNSVMCSSSSYCNDVIINREDTNSPKILSTLKTVTCFSPSHPFSSSFSNTQFSTSLSTTQLDEQPTATTTTTISSTDQYTYSHQTMQSSSIETDPLLSSIFVPQTSTYDSENDTARSVTQEYQNSNNNRNSAINSSNNDISSIFPSQPVSTTFFSSLCDGLDSSYFDGKNNENNCNNINGNIENQHNYGLNNSSMASHGQHQQHSYRTETLQSLLQKNSNVEGMHN